VDLIDDLVKKNRLKHGQYGVDMVLKEFYLGLFSGSRIVLLLRGNVPRRYVPHSTMLSTITLQCAKESGNLRRSITKGVLM
jgi:hypothetical protein